MNTHMNNVEVCTDLSGKEPHRPIGVGISGEMVTTLAQSARDVDLIPTLGTLFPIFVTQH